MANEDLDPKWETILKKTRLKEPPDDLMKNYLSEIHQKLERRHSFSFGTPAVWLIAVGILSMAGALFFIFRPEPAKQLEPAVAMTLQPEARPDLPPVLPAEIQAQAPVAQSVPAQAPAPQVLPSAPFAAQLSPEEEMAVLEALGEEVEDEVVENLGDEDLAAEASFLDETEFGFIQSAASPGR